MTRHDKGTCGGPDSCRRCRSEGRTRAPRPGEGRPALGGGAVRVTVTLHPVDAGRLDELAEEHGSRSAAVRALLRRWFASRLGR